MKLKLSAIILVYHDQEYLKKCVSSLRLSAMIAKVKLEVIIIVNDSELTKSNFIFPKNCKIIFNKKNLGFGKSINLASKIAKGEWLAIVNIDTITNKYTLKELSKYTTLNNVGIIAPKIAYPDGRIQFSILDEPTLWNIFKQQSYLYKFAPQWFISFQTNKSIYTYTHEIGLVSATFLLVRKKVFEYINGFDRDFFIYFEDIDLCRRLTALNYKVLFVSKAIVTHYGHQSGNGILRGDLFLDGLVKYLSKYHGKIYIFFGISLIFFGALFRLFYWNFKFILFLFNHEKDDTLSKIDYNRKIINYIIKL